MRSGAKVGRELMNDTFLPVKLGSRSQKEASASHTTVFHEAFYLMASEQYHHSEYFNPSDPVQIQVDETEYMYFHNINHSAEPQSDVPLESTLDDSSFQAMLSHRYANIYGKQG